MTTNNQPRPLLNTFLAVTDIACPGCSYNLRGLTSDRCPECNQHLSLRVGLTEPRMALYLTAVIGAAAGFGLSALLLVYMAIQLAVRSGHPLLGYFALHNALGTAVHGGCLALLAFRGPFFRRRTLRSRLAVAIAMWALTLLNIVLFGMFVR